MQSIHGTETNLQSNQTCQKRKRKGASRLDEPTYNEKMKDMLDRCYELDKQYNEPNHLENEPVPMYQNIHNHLYCHMI